MLISKAQRDALTIKQRIFIGALVLFSVLLSALVLFYFSPAKAISEALPCQHLSPVVYEGSVRA
jgi:uncharacterized MnhB-related membrane protein